MARKQMRIDQAEKDISVNLLLQWPATGTGVYQDEILRDEVVVQAVVGRN